MIFLSSQEARGTKCYKCLLDSILLYYVCTKFGVLWFSFLVKLFGTNGTSHLTYCLILWTLVTFVKQLKDLSISKCLEFQKCLLTLSFPFKAEPLLNHSGKLQSLRPSTKKKQDYDQTEILTFAELEFHSQRNWEILLQSSPLFIIPSHYFILPRTQLLFSHLNVAFL